MKKELYACLLIFLAFSSGMILTATTSGCDSADQLTTQKIIAQAPIANP